MDTTVNGVQSTDVLIIGAGFSGIGMGVKLLLETDKKILILERAEDVGGTWRDNRYPGAACDVPSHLYSYSFGPNPGWSHIFAKQPEILSYIRDVAGDSGVLEHIRFNSDVLDASWDEKRAVWSVLATSGRYESKILVSAVGHLSEPKFPNITGIAEYEGRLVHSAQWPRALELKGKRVAVIGSGASAIQVVPEVSAVAEHLTVFQRSAPFITPRHDHEYSAAEKRMFVRRPEAVAELRQELFWANEERYAQRRGTPSLIEAVTETALNHLAAQVPDLQLRAQLTPDYTLGCKRVLKSMDYYPALQSDHVSLITDGIEKFNSTGIVTTDGVRHEFDVIIACTGFETTDLPIAYRVHGRAGQPLSDAWANGMEAFATTAVHGFPNLWILNGPNTGLGHNSAIYIAESQIDYILGAIQNLSTNHNSLEVTREAQREYALQVDELAEGTVWLEGGCKSWYVDPRNGRLTTLWPDFAFTFRKVNSTFDPAFYLREQAKQHEPSDANLVFID